MFKIDEIILKTVRPFYIEDVILKETEIDPTQEDMVMAYLVNKVGSKIILKINVMDVRTCILLFSSMTLKSNEFFIFMMVKVEQLIEKARREHTGSSRQPDKPLIRLRVGFAFMWVKFSTDKTHFLILFLEFSCSSLLENFFWLLIGWLQWWVYSF